MLVCLFKIKKLAVLQFNFGISVARII